ncbi:hypothetical protein QQF64_036404 [Cirrhinus molitorella]|uniref:Uncharacterized protein n=1 Tax=Cirrhinus molitorella TaxID=172907 RepID=A0ABR3NJ12_9TELE
MVERIPISAEQEHIPVICTLLLLFSGTTSHLTASHGRIPEGPKAKPDTYDGKDDWDSFIIPFECRAAIYRWSTMERVDKLHECLWGAAVRYLCSLPEHIREDYFLLKEQLAFWFGKKNFQPQHVVDLETCASLKKPFQSLPKRFRDWL